MTANEGVPVEAIEAAVSAVHDHHVFCHGGNPCDCYFDDKRRTAKIMLAAALPALREGIAAEVLGPFRDLVEEWDEREDSHELWSRLRSLTRVPLSVPAQGGES